MNIRYITWGVYVAAFALLAMLVALIPIYSSMSGTVSDLNTCTKQLSEANTSLEGWCTSSPMRVGVCDGQQTVCVCGNPRQIIDELSTGKD